MSTIADVLSGRARWACIEADSAQVLPMMPPKGVDHTLGDPPFSKHVHSLQRRTLRGGGEGQTRQTHKARDGKGRGEVYFAPLGFEHLTPELRRLCGVHLPRVTRRWLIVKSDEEGRHLWQADLERAGGRHIRAGTWWKIGAQPQLSGRMPAVDREALQISHGRGEAMRWNGGGKHASWCALPEHLVYRFPIATDKNGTGERVHTTQTPLALWLAIVEDFTDPGELILDPFMGSGSLGIACVRLGRRYIGIDNGKNAEGLPWAQVARFALEAEEMGLSRGARAAGQLGLFGEAR
jgi:site-specific DNA-methyltransferase (adenine-specific)